MTTNEETLNDIIGHKESFGGPISVEVGSTAIGDIVTWLVADDYVLGTYLGPNDTRDATSFLSRKGSVHTLSNLSKVYRVGYSTNNRSYLRELVTDMNVRSVAAKSVQKMKDDRVDKKVEGVLLG